MLLPLHLNGLNLDSGTVIATVTGTFGDGATESEVVAGGTVIITLLNDTWVASGATFDAQRQAIIDGMTADGVEATGWNAEIRDVLAVTAVVRTSDTVVTITIPATATYAITGDETVTVTVPADAMTTTATELVATPTFDISADAVTDTIVGGGADRSDRFTFRNVSSIADDDDQVMMLVIQEFMRRRKRNH